MKDEASVFNTHDVCDFIHQSMATANPDTIIGVIRKRFPGIEDHFIHRAFEVLSFENDARLSEQQAAHKNESAQLVAARELFVGLPPETLFGEAVKLKAAQGNAWAIGYLAFQNTPERRCYTALVDAAYVAHPQFEALGGGVLKWTGGGEGPTEAALLDWFQLNHPADARAIERVVEDGESRGSGAA